MSTKLSDLLTAVRDRIDETTANRWSDAELTRYINKRVSWLQSRIETFNSDFFLRVETATATSGSNSMGHPSDMLGSRMRSVRVYKGASAVGAGDRIQPGSQQIVYDNQSISGTPQYYTMLAGQMKWAPSLDADSFFRLIYAVRESPLTGANSTLEYIHDEHTDIIADGAAIDALIKTDALSTINNLSAMIKDRLLEVSEDVQTSDPIMIPQTDIDSYTISD